MKTITVKRASIREEMQCDRRKWTAAIISGIVLLLAGCANCHTWNEVFARDQGAEYGWQSGDGAYSVELPGRRILWLFGDSLVSDKDGNTQMVRNSIAVHPVGLDGLPPNKEQMRFYARDANHRLMDITYRKDISSRQLSAWADPGEWLWPGDGAMVGGTLVIFYSRIDCTQGRPPGCAGEWSWERVATSVLIVKNPQDDVTRWDMSLQRTDLGKANWGCALYYEAPYLYLFGVDDNFEGRYAKYRVDDTNVRHYSDWELIGVENHIAQKLPTEFSIDKVTLHDKPFYVMVHQKLVMSYEAVVRLSESLDRWPVDIPGPSVKIKDLRTHDRVAIDGQLIWAVKAHAELTDPCLCAVNEGCWQSGCDCILVSYYSQHLQRLRFMCHPLLNFLCKISGGNSAVDQ